jgi:hypothetical protein
MAPTFMDVRTTQPMNALAKIPGVTTEMLIREMKVEPIKDKSIPHILILQRHIPQDAKAWKEKILRVADMGWLVVSEWDDHPDKLPPGIRERFGEAGWMAFTAAHAVQTSTSYLQAVFHKFNPNMMVFPNCVETIRLNKIKNKKPKSIFFGALNRKTDWIPIMNQLNQFGKENPEINWSIMLDKEFYENIESKNKRFIEAGSYNKYINELDANDVCLMPLNDNEANRCKSDVKYIEASSRGMASIMSKVVYENTVKNDLNGLLVNNNEWYQGLRKLFHEENYALKISQNALTYIKEERMLEKGVKLRLEEYRKIYKNINSVNKQLIERLQN